MHRKTLTRLNRERLLTLKLFTVGFYWPLAARAENDSNAGAKSRAGSSQGQALECPFLWIHRAQTEPANETGAIETMQTA